MNIKRLVVVAVAMLGATLTAPAAVIINIVQQGSDVVATANGTINLQGLIDEGSGTDVPGTQPNTPVVLVGLGSPTVYWGGGTLTGGSIGAGGSFIQPDSAAGTLVGIQDTLLVLSNGYSGGSINSTATFLNTSLSALGLVSGSVILTLPSDTVTINVGDAVTPEPGTLGMLAGGGLGILTYTRRKRQ